MNLKAIINCKLQKKKKKFWVNSVNQILKLLQNKIQIIIKNPSNIVPSGSTFQSFGITFVKVEVVLLRFELISEKKKTST